MNTRAIFSVCVLLSVSGLAQAGQITGTPVIGDSVGGWQSFPGSVNSTAPGRPYWDNPSMDGGNRNIGNWINGTYTPNLPAGSVPNSGPAALDWWGYNQNVTTARGNSTNAAGTMHFAQSGGLTYEASLLLEVAGFRNVNEVGWYDASSETGLEVLNPIFAGNISPVTTTTFTPTAAWGLYIRTYNGFSAGSGNGTLFFMQAGRNRSVGSNLDAIPGQQHFAVFGLDKTLGNEQYIVGIEDLTLAQSGIELQGDFNDVVLSLRVVPTPGAAALLGLGGILATRRRRVV